MAANVKEQNIDNGGASSKARNSYIQEIEAKFPERPNAKRKICFLFRNSSVSECYRVNFSQHSGEFVESYWVEVKDGVVGVSPETNSVVKLNPK